MKLIPHNGSTTKDAETLLFQQNYRVHDEESAKLHNNLLHDNRADKDAWMFLLQLDRIKQQPKPKNVLN